MSSTNVFKPQTIESPKKHQFKIDAFRGVDFRPIQLQVADHNAIDIKNIIYRDNANQKRNGYEHLLTIPIETYYQYGDTSTLKTNINNNVYGIWEFTDTLHNKHVIAHIGRLLYEIKNINKTYDKITYKMICEVDTNQKKITFEMYDAPSGTFSAFSLNGVLFILGGSKYYALYNGEKELSDKAIETSDGLVLCEVQDSHFAYIPTTTIGITTIDSVANNQTMLDKVNILSQYRKNKLVSGVIKDDDNPKKTLYNDYELDDYIKTKNEDYFALNNISVSITEYVLQDGGD